MRLLRSELVRFRSRRAVVLLLALGFVLAVVVTGTTLWQNRPFDERDREQAREVAAQQVEECEQHPGWFGRKGKPETCVELVQEAEEQPENFVWRYPQDYDQLAQDLPLTLMASLLFVALLAGVTFIGADVASGALSNTLLFRPNRWQVWAAKLTAVMVWTAVVAAVTLTLCLGALALTASSDPRTGMGPGDAGALVGRGVRALLVVVGGAAAGAAITTAVRSTVAAVGVAIGYLLIGEAVLRAVFTQSVEPFLASTRAVAFVRPDLRISTWDERTGLEQATVLHMWPSAALLGGALLVVCAACAVVFSRRDVP
jgi:ABC-2 type transport system permease protein